MPENSDTFYLKVVGIPSLPNRNITKKIYFCNYDENDVADKYRWGVDSNGLVGPFLYAIEDEKEFDDGRDNTVSMVGEGHFEVKDQSGKFVPILDENIDAMEKDNFIMRFWREG